VSCPTSDDRLRCSPERSSQLLVCWWLRWSSAGLTSTVSCGLSGPERTADDVDQPFGVEKRRGGERRVVRDPLRFLLADRGFFEPRTRPTTTSRALRSLEARLWPGERVRASLDETRWLSLPCSSERGGGKPTATGKVHGSSRDPAVPRGSPEPSGVLTVSIRLSRALQQASPAPRRGALRSPDAKGQRGVGFSRVLRQSRRNPHSSSELEGARLDDRWLTKALFGARRMAADFQSPADVLSGAQRAASGADGLRSLSVRWQEAH